MFCGNWAYGGWWFGGWGFWLLVAGAAALAAWGFGRKCGPRRGDSGVFPTCAGCGAGLREEWKVCPNCGRRQSVE